MCGALMFPVFPLESRFARLEPESRPFSANARHYGKPTRRDETVGLAAGVAKIYHKTMWIVDLSPFWQWAGGGFSADCCRAVAIVPDKDVRRDNSRRSRTKLD